jgi:DNA mismatch repair protein MutL
MKGHPVERIQLLPEGVQKKIAAGEVVEGPFSIVKELVENSVDAGAAHIDVQVHEGGLKKITVRDDGRGIYRQDIPLAVMEHATSKIRDIADIEGIGTYGFRGEALSSISSVSRMTLLSRRAEEEIGGRLAVSDAGAAVSDHAGPAGTTIIVENLFYNVPARKKFLKAARTELRLVREAVLKIAIPNPDISFTLDVDDARGITLPAAGSLDHRIEQVYGSGILDDLQFETLSDLKVTVSGYCSKPHFLKSSRSMQMLFINRRPVEYRYLGFLLSRAYEAVAVRGRYPAGLVFIDIDPRLVDVNIHPAKKEVKLFDHRYIERLILGLAEKALNREHRVDTKLFTAEGAPEGAAPRGEEPDAGARQGAMFHGADGTARPAVPSTGRPSAFVRDVAGMYRDLGDGAGTAVIGMAFGTYLVLERDDSLYLVDVHAAHERIIFDELIEKRSAAESQRLAFPRVIELPLDDHALIMENIGTFSEIGFDIEDFSDTSIKVSAVPVISRDDDVADIFTDFLEEMRGGAEQPDVIRSIAASVACRSAKRAGDRVSTQEMAHLAEQIFTGDRQLRCPHGRPFVYRIGRDEIERMFKRQ